jgi:hypothetical protein
MEPADVNGWTWGGEGAKELVKMRSARSIPTIKRSTAIPINGIVYRGRFEMSGVKRLLPLDFTPAAGHRKMPTA